MKKINSTWFGDKLFYKSVFSIALPIMIQNGLTSIVGLLDSVMVGRIGTEEMTAVTIVNQLLFVFSIGIFGAVAGASIFGAQFFGKGDNEGVRHTFRFKFYICYIIAILFFLAFFLFDEELIKLYIHKTADDVDVELTLSLAKSYMRICLIKIIPFTLTQIYASTLRETGETKAPMFAGIIAISSNLVGNWIFIFGNLGSPEMGVNGAAIATVIATFIEAIIIVSFTHIKKSRFVFIQNAFKGFSVPKKLIVMIMRKGSMLLINEILWAIGFTYLLQCYSFRGLNVISALNITFTLAGLFQIVFMAFGGGAVPIMVGQLLGENKFAQAKLTAQRLIAFSFLTAVAVGGVMVIMSPFFPNLYNTSDKIKSLATAFIIVEAFSMLHQSIAHAEYFTLRSGGKTGVTFIFDCVFLWLINIPTALILSKYTNIDIIFVYFICKSLDIIKCIFGFVMVQKGVWLKNIVDFNSQKSE